MKRIGLMLGMMIVPILLATGCSGSGNDQTDSGKLDIYTSIYPLEYLAEQIGGEHVAVQSVYPPGVDAHTFEPTSKTVTDIAKSDAFLYMGAGMEGFAETTAAALKKQNVKLLEIGKNAALFNKAAEEDVHEGHSHGDKDPHVWLDPQKMIIMAEMIEEDFSKWDPDHSEDYDNNLETVKEKLTALDAEFSSTLGKRDKKPILVSHAAYGYWERYGIEQLSIRGISSSDEPSQKQLAETARRAEKLGLHYIIFEKNEEDRLGDIIKKQIGAKALHIHNLEVLTQKEVDEHADYMSLMKDNLKVLEITTQK